MGAAGSGGAVRLIGVVVPSMSVFGWYTRGSSYSGASPVGMGCAAGGQPVSDKSRQVDPNNTNRCIFLMS